MYIYWISSPHMLEELLSFFITNVALIVCGNGMERILGLHTCGLMRHSILRRDYSTAALGMASRIKCLNISILSR